MKQDIIKKIEIPEDVTLTLEKNEMNVKGPKGQNRIKIYHPMVSIKRENDTIVLEVKKSSKREKKILNTLRAHINNFIRGAKTGYECQLKICSGHFPMNVSIQSKQIVIKNFFGEKIPRKAKILDDVEVKIEGDIIKVSGVDRDKVGQTASNIEQSTRRANFDKRVYQDGIWIIKKAK
nr:50S ribosomal protein L6P [uncultured archaeon]